jgi:quinolinate synthase
VIVHPEVPWDVVQAADDSGSTEYIIKTVVEQPQGVGLGGRDRGAPGEPPRARRGAGPHGDLARSVRLPVLDDVPGVAEPPAVDLEELVEGRVHNRIVVPDEQKHWTKVALDRMLSIV